MKKALVKGEVVSFQGINSAGSYGQLRQITVGDAISVAKPTINKVTNMQTSVTGTAPANSTVKLTINGTTYTGTASSSGSYTITIPKQNVGTVISATATQSGVTSAATTTTVVNGDTTAPNAPVINSITNTQRVVTGTAEAYSTVILYVNSTIVGTGTATASGTFSITMNSTYATGTLVRGTAKDAAGNVSAYGSRTVTSSDTIAPNAPGIDAVSDNQRVVTGTAEAYSTVKLYIGGALVGTTTATASGTYSITMSSTYPAGTVIQGTATDAAGNVSAYGSRIVTANDTTAPNAPSINAITDKQVVVTGTAEANSTVKLYVNGTVVGTGTATSTGTYSITMNSTYPVGTVVQANATDAAGNVGPYASRVVTS
ncbi:Ig-like domain-containing protein, partial [Listeria floridensis]|uniref:Ig-like domain-containing protein n=1 Tax=Listeria floridensis TaxID=1494962 RepID=UPI001F4D0BED